MDFLLIILANVLGFGTAYFIESKVQHLYKSSIKLIRYLNYFAFLFIGIGLIKIFNEFLRVVALQESVRIVEIGNGLVIFILILPVTFFLIAFVISKNVKKQSSNDELSADVIENLDITKIVQSNLVITSSTKEFAIKTLIVTLAVLVILLTSIALFKLLNFKEEKIKPTLTINKSNLLNLNNSDVQINLSKCFHDDGKPANRYQKTFFISNNILFKTQYSIFDEETKKTTYPTLPSDTPCSHSSPEVFSCIVKFDFLKDFTSYTFDILNNKFEYIIYKHSLNPDDSLTLKQRCTIDSIVK